MPLQYLIVFVICIKITILQLYLQDRYSSGNEFPAEDDSQDVHLISGSEVNGETTIKFTRKHNTCDDKDMVVGVRAHKQLWDNLVRIILLWNVMSESTHKLL